MTNHYIVEYTEQDFILFYLNVFFLSSHCSVIYMAVGAGTLVTDSPTTYFSSSVSRCPIFACTSVVFACAYCPGLLSKFNPLFPNPPSSTWLPDGSLASYSRVRKDGVAEDAERGLRRVKKKASRPTTLRQQFKLLMLRLNLHLLSLADLGGETSLDGGDGTTGAAVVAGDKVQTVLGLVELGIGRLAGLAGDVFD